MKEGQTAAAPPPSRAKAHGQNQTRLTTAVSKSRFMAKHKGSAQASTQREGGGDDVPLPQRRRSRTRNQEDASDPSCRPSLFLGRGWRGDLWESLGPSATGVRAAQNWGCGVLFCSLLLLLNVSQRNLEMAKKKKSHRKKPLNLLAI